MNESRVAQPDGPVSAAARDPRRVGDVLEHTARRLPDAPALHESGSTWTYADLLEASNRLARRLTGCGVGNGDRVMIVAENGFAQVAAFFAAGALGAWPALVNARGSEREIAAIRSHALPRVVVFGTGASEAARVHAEREGAQEFADLPGPPRAGYALSATDRAAEPETGPQASEVGALIYTSGTTGAPKGVLATHRGLLSFAERSAAVRRLQASDVVLGALPMSHIFGVATILLTTLRAGASILLQPRFDAAATVAALRAGRLTVLHGVPTLYVRLLDELDREGLRPPLAGLRYIYAGGGALDPALKRRVERALGLALHHGYGMTEYAGSMFVTHVDRPRDDALPGERAPDCEVRFVGPDGCDATAGEPGEIWVRGPGTMLGYYRDPELTRATITDDGWLRTGDLGFLAPDGALRIVSRARDIIKRSGFTVYPQEVEQQLAEHPRVRQAGVVGIAAEAADETIVAFVEARDPADRLDGPELIAFLRQRLSHYKVPQQVVQVRELPLTANGKIRKQALRELWRAQA